MDGQQKQTWRDHYESAWKARADFMKAVIAEGETEPMRVIKALEKKESIYTLLVDDKTMRSEWRRHGNSLDKGGERLATGVPAFKRVIIRGQFVEVPYYASTSNHEFIVDYLEGAEFDCLVELGCGFGRNLFEVFYGGGPDDIEYLGAELSASGLELFETLASLNPRMRVRAIRFDILDPDFSFLADYENVLVFTSHAIEQVTSLDANFVTQLAKAALRVVGIHFEPFGFQVSPALGPATRIHKENILANEWNVDLVHRLVEARNEGAIRILTLAPEASFTDANNPTSIAVWESA